MRFFRFDLINDFFYVIYYSLRRFLRRLRKWVRHWDFFYFRFLFNFSGCWSFWSFEDSVGLRIEAVECIFNTTSQRVKFFSGKSTNRFGFGLTNHFFYVIYYFLRRFLRRLRKWVRHWDFFYFPSCSCGAFNPSLTSVAGFLRASLIHVVPLKLCSYF